MTTSESKGRFFLQNESIQIDSRNESNRIESNRIANWNALLDAQVYYTLVDCNPLTPLLRFVLDLS